MDQLRSRSGSNHREVGMPASRASSPPFDGAGRAGGAGALVARQAVRGLLLLALAGASLSLMQCRMVDDRLTGVGIGGVMKSDCAKACKESYKEALKAERQLHQDNVRACDRDADCLAAEEERHLQAEQAIEQAYADCLYQCHLQGGGSAGP